MKLAWPPDTTTDDTQRPLSLLRLYISLLPAIGTGGSCWGLGDTDSEPYIFFCDDDILYFPDSGVTTRMMVSLSEQNFSLFSFLVPLVLWVLGELTAFGHGDIGDVRALVGLS